MTGKPVSGFSRRQTILYSTVILVALFAIMEVISYVVISSVSVTGTFGERKLENRFALLTGWEPTPDTTSDTSKPASPRPTSIRTDAEGFSITPLSWDRPDLRIVVTGGSTMFGVGSSGNATTVPSLLEKKIHERLGMKAEVTNIAVRGYQSFQEAMRLREYLLGHPADLVLAVSGRNDAMRARLTDDLSDGLLPSDVVGPGLRLVRAAELQKPVVLHPEGWLREHSYFFDLMARVVLRLAGATRFGFGDEPQSSAASDHTRVPLGRWAALTGAHYRMMNALAASYGAEFLFVLQPTAYSWNAFPADVREILADRETHDRNRAQENAFYDLLRKADGTPMVDLSAAMTGRSDSMYIDNCHYTDAGADVLAEALLRTLELRLRRLAARQATR